MLVGKGQTTRSPAEISLSAAPVTTAPVSPRIELIEAAKRGDVPTTRKLLEGGNSDLSVADGFGRTALHYAARLGHEDIMRILIEAGAQVDAKDNDGYTPLLRAIQGGDSNFGAVRQLLDAGADRTTRAGDVGAVELARSIGALKLVDLLAP
jgi:ankyrin repeat protein